MCLTDLRWRTIEMLEEPPWRNGSSPCHAMPSRDGSARQCLSTCGELGKPPKRLCLASRPGRQTQDTGTLTAASINH